MFGREPGVLTATAVQVVKERRQWKRFGEAVKESADDNYTVQAVEEIPFERIQKQKQTQAEKKEAADLKSALAGTDKQAIVGRCGLPAISSCSDRSSWHVGIDAYKCSQPAFQRLFGAVPALLSMQNGVMDAGYFQHLPPWVEENIKPCTLSVFL